MNWFLSKKHHRIKFSMNKLSLLCVLRVSKGHFDVILFIFMLFILSGTPLSKTRNNGKNELIRYNYFHFFLNNFFSSLLGKALIDVHLIYYIVKICENWVYLPERFLFILLQISFLSNVVIFINWIQNVKPLLFKFYHWLKLS